MNSFPILSSIIILPLFGALISMLVKGNDKDVARNVRDLALWISIVELVLVILLCYQFDFNNNNFQNIEKKVLLSKFDISYFLGVDALSLVFILLTSILFPICIFYTKFSIKFRTKEFMVCFLILEALVMGVFSCLDIVLFYIFFESLLIPMFLIIGIWGGQRRIFASYKFFLYTLAGSVFFLISIIVMASIANTTSIVELDNYYFDIFLQKWLWIGMFLSFAIKVPMWPFHTWLPDAHVEAPTVGSIILAGILLKVGGYAFLRLSLPILPDASAYFANSMIIISIISIIYTSFVAVAQDDIKKMIAYSSVAHMGYVTAGIFSLTAEGIKGAIFQMVSHGIVSSALFLSIGFLYERTKSREIKHYSFLVKSMPTFSFLFIIIVLSSVGLPGTSGFIGELFSVLGVYKYNAFFGFFVATGLILGAIYMLRLVREIIFTIENNKVLVLNDLILSEKILLLFFVIITLLLGIFPNLLISFIDGYTLKLIKNY
ncbi:MAG: NADH-quinone oxidoreductase subunit M [Pelagibacterales bacterium]|nr:NADH-quinone oxidoreductase subunit M [Pelagibacterales bacterium]